MTTSDTIKILADFRSNLKKAEKELEQKFSIDKQREVSHLQTKIKFYESVDPEQYQANGNMNSGMVTS